MIFRDDEHGIGGWDPRVVLIFSIIDYLHFYFQGIPLTFLLANKCIEFLPFWLSFFLAISIWIMGSFLIVLGPLLLVYLIFKGWQNIDKE